MNLFMILWGYLSLIGKHSYKKLYQLDFIDTSIKITELIKCFLVFVVEKKKDCKLP